MIPLSVLVIAKNEEDNLPECLASCRFAGEVLVVDAGSADRTREIAQAAGARVVEHSFESHAKQKNWGLQQLANDWVLVVDADERVPETLALEIRALLAREAGPPRAGYWIYRRSTFLGREIRGAGWQRDRVLRFFDRRRARYAERLIHEEVELSQPPAGILHERLLHHPCRDLTSWMEKVNRYASAGAREAWSKGERATFLSLLLRPPARFAKQYVVQGGFRDGWEGLLLCAISSFGVFLKYAKLREIARSQ
ncbi:MAG TPA: glycosyltransferase family 2 protein [bacterium]|nr:glycosyltransferase family 2 protein [bacterium]